MKHCLLGCLLLLAGCAKSFVRTPAPAQPIAMEEAVVANGVLQPQDLSFTLISQYQAPQTRVIILTMPAIKLADMTVSAEKVQLHYRATHIPAVWVQRWAKLVQEYLLTTCPPREIKRTFSNPTQNFELEVTGGICL